MRLSVRALLFSLFVLTLVAIGCNGATDPDDAVLPTSQVEETGQVSQALTTLNWAGRTWYVKNGAGMGPGPNNWSDSTSSVWVDGTGSLNLKIRKSGGKWYCAEVWLPASLGYGTYEFFVKSRVDNQHPRVVAGFFLYQDDTHELDIEWSKWGNANHPSNGEFNVQPYYTPGNHYGFVQAFQDGFWHKHRIIWTPTSVSYNVETNSVIVQQWTYAGPDNFAPGSELVHINHWLFQGVAPSAATTLTLANFTFTPL